LVNIAIVGPVEVWRVDKARFVLEVREDRKCHLALDGRQLKMGLARANFGVSAMFGRWAVEHACPAKVTPLSKAAGKNSPTSESEGGNIVPSEVGGLFRRGIKVEAGVPAADIARPGIPISLSVANPVPIYLAHHSKSSVQLDTDCWRLDFRIHASFSGLDLHAERGTR
jgi:hypothetical protein